MSIRLNPYLIFEGKAREAVHFYAEVFSGEIQGLMAFGDMPANPAYPLPDEVKDWIMHAQLKIGEDILMFSDTFPGMPHSQGDSVQIAIHPDSEEQVRNIFAALEADGEAIMPLQQTEWSGLYGIVKDKFGVHFQINLAEPQP